MFRVLLVVVFAMASPAFAQDDGPGRITVSGEGMVAAAPDTALISLGVTAQARTARDALTENNARMSAVLEQLRGAGIEDRDLQTSGLSLQPQWDGGKSGLGQRARIVAYIVTNQVSVRVRDLGKLGAILDLAVSDGANTFHNLVFSVAEDAELKDAARRAAVTDARARAELFAEALGVSLGPILSFDEVEQGRGPVMMARMESMAADAVPVAGGEVGITARVNIVYAIEQ